MNEILDVEIILKKQKYSYIYNIGTILIIIILIFLYISVTYNYKTYYISKGTMKNNQLELSVDINNIKYITNNQQLIIDDKIYTYKVEKISDDLYVDESFNNYKYIYLKINNLNNLNNYVYDLKILKEDKKIILYLKDYL